MSTEIALGLVTLKTILVYLILILFISWQVIYKKKISNHSKSDSNPLNKEEEEELKSIIEKFKSG